MTSDAAPTLTGLTPAERERIAELVQTVKGAEQAIARLEAVKARALTELAGIAHASGERSPNRDGIDYARRAMAADIAAKAKADGGTASYTTVQGEPLMFMKSGSGWGIMDGKGHKGRITIADVRQSNGLIHVIDTVMLP